MVCKVQSMKVQSLVRRALRVCLPLRVQVRLGITKLRASIDPLDSLLRVLSKSGPLSVIEIGTRYGDSLRYCALNFRIREYHAIDPYVDYDDYGSDGFNAVLKEKDGHSIASSVGQLGRELLGKRFFLHREFSDAASASFSAGTADLIFVDGNHSYDFVKRDLENYWPILKDGGFLTGHDFFMRSVSNGGDYDEPMVFEAVIDFASENDLQVQEFGSHRGFPMCFAIEKN